LRVDVFHVSLEMLERERYCILPLEMLCHVSPYLLPQKYCSQFELVEHDVMRKLLPKVTGGGFYDNEAQALNCKRQIWVPKNLHVLLGCSSDFRAT
jgi:hypothetical protein